MTGARQIWDETKIPPLLFLHGLPESLSTLGKIPQLYIDTLYISDLVKGGGVFDEC